MTQPDTLHTRLKFRIDVLLDIARAATPGPWEYATVRGVTSVGAPGVLPSVAADVHFDIDVHYLVAFSPATTIPWLEGELEVLERHKPEIRNVEWWDAPDVGKAPVCPTCAVAEPHEWDLGVGNYGVKPDGWVSAYILAPCAEIRSLAHRLGVSIDV